MLLIGPLLLIQLAHLFFSATGNATVAKSYLLGGYSGVVDWADVTPAVMIGRASALPVLFVFAIVIIFGVGNLTISDRVRMILGSCALTVWLALLLV